jgi:hypothetical protein
MVSTKRTMAAWLVVVGGLAAVSAYLVQDTSGAHLRLAPLFVGTALVVTCVRLFRSGSGDGPSGS